jgi:hypothetical protein
MDVNAGFFVVAKRKGVRGAPARVEEKSLTWRIVFFVFLVWCEELFFLVNRKDDDIPF